jgi:hypothetical protein
MATSFNQNQRMCVARSTWNPILRFPLTKATWDPFAIFEFFENFIKKVGQKLGNNTIIWS